MKWTGLNELREKFLSFFESKQHLRYPSASLVPADDGSLLLINSGMAPLKNYFLGIETPPSKRMATCQKCIRTPDIEEVGKTSRHGTFFEMLGNFSFGDYFKNEAIEWAWEFFTKELEIPVDRLWITIYEDDDEAHDIWAKKIGVDESRIVRMGKEDNFWEIGSGPCGPCSEIHYDRGEEYSCGDNCGIGKCDCDRYMEVWNLVFTQFDSDGKGNYTPLEHPNIDTGMGLERIAVVMQDVGNLFEVDTIENIMNKISELTGVKYKTDNKTDVSLRVITDHIRATTFMVADGVLPSNEGRGYVLRRLLRRGARHGHLLGLKEPFLYKVVDTVIDENKHVYPELEENKDYIKNIIKVEEERFSKTIQQGMEVLAGMIDRLEIQSVKNPMIDGKDAFQLYDTFGFPIDLTREIASDHGVKVDEDGFAEYMEEQRKRAREAHAAHGGLGWEADVLSGSDIEDEFVGYKSIGAETKILAIIKDNILADKIAEGEQAILILEKTPFYAESGGQVGDTGTITHGGSIFTVNDTQKTPTGHIAHIGVVTKGSIEKAEKVHALIDKNRRRKITRNHTGVHLLQAGLIHVLGDHVHQAGSYVDDKFARFDFTHFSAVTKEELQRVEAFVNERILESIPVVANEMLIAEAKAQGAIALFGDKYSEIVRVCSIGETSAELCGGTHVSNTAQIGAFKITSESSVAAGVRRIEIITSVGVLDYLDSQSEKLRKIGGVLKANSLDDLIGRAAAVAEQLSQQEKRIAQLEAEVASSKTEDFTKNLTTIGSVKLGALAIAGEIGPLQLKADELKDKHPDLVGVMIAMGDTSATVLVFAGKDAVKAGVHSGNLVKELTAIAGGKGGGRPDNAKGGMPDITKVDEAITKAKELVENQLS